MKKFTMPQIFLNLPNHLWNQPRGLGVLALLSSVFMFACGDAGTSEATVEKGCMDVVASATDLPKCSDDNAGELYLVKDDADVYVCTGKEWKVLGGSSGGSVSDEDVVSLEKLNGVSQKGPFINGSTVTLFELDGSRSLVQTGRTFGGEIITDDGRFSVNNVSLKSSYVRLTANGFYRNEVSGKNSTSSIVLNAYSDLQARNSVNINLLTHLEYYRVGYLMENGLESTIKASKKRAQKEIFAAFGIDNDGFGYSEDLDVFGEGDQNAALLAISILLQGERNESELSELLASFGKDIEEDGKWDDAATRAKIADWADSVAFGLKGKLTLSKIESNISGWRMGSVPAFQKYIRKFLGKEYGFGVCGADNKGEIAAVTNELVKAYGDRCYCSSNGWVRPTTWNWEVSKEFYLNPEITYGTIKDSRDGKIYKTVKIGDQVWMAENLNYADSTKTLSLKGESWCYDNKIENCDVTGRLYTWAAAIDSVALANDADNPQTCGYGETCDVATNASTAVVRGICPEGWHLPGESDWSVLWTAVGGMDSSRIKLMSPYGWNFLVWSSNPIGNALGFSVLPAGIYVNGDFVQGSGWTSTEFNEVGEGANFWSSTEDDSDRAYSVSFGPLGVFHGGYNKYRGLSIRCLCDTSDESICNKASK